ncbi:MAG: hypothetical protein ABS75_04785 [Pelagibacterium sp. SCN 63-23]|nr:MAG: hypothetical protein ABS75_04785 [Pelagibacterium sp. SCN 63-23]
MDNDQFVALAVAAALNAQGKCRLAAHVRRLYGAIRKLQQEDNSFFYIAGVIQSARNDKTDPTEFMTRIKTYYHRHRKSVGDPLVKPAKGVVTNVAGRYGPSEDESKIGGKKVVPETSAQSSEGTFAEHTLGLNDHLTLQSLSGVEDTDAGALEADPNETSIKAQRSAQKAELVELHRALYRRPGRRKVVDSD